MTHTVEFADAVWTQAQRISGRSNPASFLRDLAIAGLLEHTTPTPEPEPEPDPPVVKIDSGSFPAEFGPKRCSWPDCDQPILKGEQAMYVEVNGRRRLAHASHAAELHESA